MARRYVPVRVVDHRGHRIEVFDDSGCGWRLLIHSLQPGTRPEVLRNRMPNGLDELLTEARERIDRLYKNYLEDLEWP